MGSGLLRGGKFCTNKIEQTLQNLSILSVKLLSPAVGLLPHLFSSLSPCCHYHAPPPSLATRRHPPHCYCLLEPPVVIAPRPFSLLLPRAGVSASIRDSNVTSPWHHHKHPSAKLTFSNHPHPHHHLATYHPHSHLQSPSSSSSSSSSSSPPPPPPPPSDYIYFVTQSSWLNYQLLPSW